MGAATADACTFIPVTRDQSDSMKSLTWQVPLLVLMLLVMFGHAIRWCVQPVTSPLCAGGSSDGTSKTATFKMEDFEGQNYQSEKVALTSTLTVLSLLLIRFRQPTSLVY